MLDFTYLNFGACGGGGAFQCTPLATGLLPYNLLAKLVLGVPIHYRYTVPICLKKSSILARVNGECRAELQSRS